MEPGRKLRLLLVSIVPPQNDCGVRIVMHRHLVERSPFELHVATNTPEAWNPDLKVTLLELPYALQRLRKSRFGPRLGKWFADYENFILPLTRHPGLDRCIEEFKPDVILTLAETGLCHLAARTANRHRIPLACLFLDWFPIMAPHYGHKVFQGALSRRYRRLYQQCNLAICTSDGMKEVLGPHPNSHVVYPMPGRHKIAGEAGPGHRGKFRLVYVGSAQNCYGRMLRSLLAKIRDRDDLELIIVGPTADWPAAELELAKREGYCLGFMPPFEAAKVLTSADVLLVVMSFEPDQQLFMRTSFTTKFLDYVAFGKPVILWGPDYCTPSRLATRDQSAIVVNHPASEAVVDALKHLRDSPAEVVRYAAAAARLRDNLFSPGRLQRIFVDEISKLIPVNQKM